MTTGETAMAIVIAVQGVLLATVPLIWSRHNKRSQAAVDFAEKAIEAEAERRIAKFRQKVASEHRDNNDFAMQYRAAVGAYMLARFRRDEAMNEYVKVRTRKHDHEPEVDNND